MPWRGGEQLGGGGSTPSLGEGSSTNPGGPAGLPHHCAPGGRSEGCCAAFGVWHLMRDGGARMEPTGNDPPSKTSRTLCVQADG